MAKKIQKNQKQKISEDAISDLLLDFRMTTTIWLAPKFSDELIHKEKNP